MSMRLDSLAAVAAFRRAQGDVVEEKGSTVVAGRVIERHPTAGEVRWMGEAGVVHVTGPLPLEVPDHAVTAVALEVLKINSQLTMPGLVMRRLPAGWRVFFIGMAFLDEDGTISTHTFEMLLDFVRWNAISHLSKLAAQVAEASAPATTRALADYRRLNPKFTAPDMGALRDAIARDCADFMPRIRNSMVAEVEQPFFKTARIIEVLSPEPLPARALFLALDQGGRVEVLSRHASRLRDLAARETITAEHEPAFVAFAAVVTADDRTEATQA